MQSQASPATPAIDWGEIVQWCKFYLSSDHNGTESIAALIGGVHHREYRRIDEDTLHLDGGTYHRQRAYIDGEEIYGFRAEGLSDKDYIQMLKLTLLDKYKEEIFKMVEEPNISL